MKSVIIALLATVGFILLCHWTTGEDWGWAGGDHETGVGGGTFEANSLVVLFALCPWLFISAFVAAVIGLVSLLAVGGDVAVKQAKKLWTK